MRIGHLKNKTREVSELQREMQQAEGPSAAKELANVNNQTIRDLSHLERLFKHLTEFLYEKDRRNSGVRIR